MARLSNPAQSRKVELEISFASACPGLPLLCMITDARGRQSDYWVSFLPSAWGVAARFQKGWDGAESDFADECYETIVDPAEHFDSCECMGHLRHGDCRHQKALRIAVDQGILKFSPRPEHADEIPAKAEKGELTYGAEFDDVFYPGDFEAI
jgi:hypothetical protein